MHKVMWKRKRRATLVLLQLREVAVPADTITTLKPVYVNMCSVTGNLSHWEIDGTPTSEGMRQTGGGTERSKATGLIRLSQIQGRNVIIRLSCLPLCQYELLTLRHSNRGKPGYLVGTSQRGLPEFQQPDRCLWSGRGPASNQCLSY